MKQTCKRSLAMLMALVLCLSLLPALHLGADAADFEYVYDSTGKYIYNWGTRGETATTLSPNAIAFYTNTSYGELADFAGGTGTSDAPGSDLYQALQKLMKDAHTYVNAYKEANTLLQYTDCQNNGGKISSFYSGKEIGPAWDSGATWNKEHTWPNSKGDASGEGENDIMMLRPTAASENSSRGNAAYGVSAGYYYPNKESNDTYDVRGDVARIMLYVYVRWGNTGSMWGSDGVIESLDVLLTWMAEDPVDTWELGRNDSVESITGTRNVFVDYPELAFLLFGAEVPTDMVTPSGMASGCQHVFDAGEVTAPTCTTKGYTTYICQIEGCGYSYKGKSVPALGHTMESGACKVCGATAIDIVNAAYALKDGQSLPYAATLTGVISAVDESYSATYQNITVTIRVAGAEDKPIKCYRLKGDGVDTLNVNDIITVTGTLKNYQGTIEFDTGCTLDKVTQMAPPAQAVIGVVDAPKVDTAYKFGMIQGNVSDTTVYYLSGGMSGYYMATSSDVNSAIDVYLEATEGGYYLYTLVAGTKTYINMVVSGTHVNGAYETTASTVYTFDTASKTLIANVNGEDYWFGTRNDEKYTTVGPVKVSYNGFYCQLYGELGDAECEHQYTSVVTEPTCVKDGYTTYTCESCGYSYTDNVTPATGEHTYVEGVCTGCGAQEPTGIQVTISFADKANRTEFSTSKQVWEQNGILVTNEKGSATSNVADYANPARFYKGSKVTIAFPNMIKIEIDCHGLETKYVDGWLSVTGATATKENGIVTIVFDSPADVLTYASLSAQSRAYSMTIYAAEEDCQHTNTKTENAKDATCKEEGYTGDVRCADCGELIEPGDKIPTTSHYYDENGKCIYCGEEESQQPEGPVVHKADFETIVTSSPNGDSSYKNTYTTTNGWTIVNSAIQTGGSTASNPQFPVIGPDNSYKAPCLNGKTSAPGKVTSPVLTGGISKLTMRYTKMFTDTKLAVTITITDLTSGATYTQTVSRDVAKDADKYVVWEYVWELETPISGNFTIEVVNACPSNKNENKDRFTILELAWEQSGCQHDNVTVTGAKDATCTEDGYTGNAVCSDCGQIVRKGEVIAAPGHKYVNYICDVCGEEDPEAPKYTIYFVVPEGVNAIASMACGPKGVSLPAAGQIEGYTFLGWVTGAVDHETTAPEYLGEAAFYSTDKDIVLYALYTYEQASSAATTGSASLSFSDKANRTEFSTSKQVWEQNGVKLVNDKGSATSNVADYANPARFYAGSKLTVFRAGMTKIVFTCSSSSYATALKNSIGTVSGATVSVSGSNVTVTFASAQDSFVIAKLTAQVRMSSLKVEYSVAGAVETYYTTVIGENACAHISTQIVAGPEATCTESGFQTKLVCLACEKDLTMGLPVAALGHDLGQYEGKAPTCTEPGWDAYESCARCDYTTYQEIPVAGHKYEAVVTAPTCTEEGYTTYTCACGETYVDDTVEALGHDLIQHEGQEATCTEFGWEAYESCSRCDHTTYVQIPAKGHSYVAEVLEATCTEPGYTTYTCSVCGDSYVSDHVEALGHDGVASGGYAATCTEDGLTDLISCSRCGVVLVEQEVIFATGHNYKSKVTKPDCTQHGYTTYTCTSCNDSYTCDYVKPVGHRIVINKGKKPTCTEDGWTESSYCKTCGEVLSVRAIILATGHSYKGKETAPTCTEPGYTTYTCTVCRDSYVSDYVEASGHSYNGMVTAPTCAEQGYTTYTCSVCRDSYVSDYVEPTGHSYNAVVTAPTCTEEGYTTFTCDCGDSYVGAYVPENGHSYETVVTEPTCIYEGYTTYTCTVCGDSYVDDYVEAVGHAYDAVVTAPTCTEAGYTTYTCTVCGDSYVGDYVEATGHNMVNGECTNCGYREYIPGDVNGDGVVTTCDAKRIMQYDLGMIDAEGLILEAADVNGDGKVDTSDAKLIMQMDLGMGECPEEP